MYLIWKINFVIFISYNQVTLHIRIDFSEIKWKLCGNILMLIIKLINQFLLIVKDIIDSFFFQVTSL